MYKFGFVVVVFLVLSLFSGIVAANDGPTAALSASATTIVEGQTVTFDGSGSSDSDGYIVEYKYQYGDGNSSGWLTDSTNSWSYPVAGTYNARLRVKDNGSAMSGWSPTVAITVTVNQAPSADLSASATTIVEGQTMTFDTSGSSDPDGSIASYWYDYGNGSDSGWVTDSTHSFSYSAAGTYSAKLKVKDNGSATSGWSSTVAITVTVANVAENQAPSAVLSASPMTVGEGGIVTFDGSGSSDPDGSIASYWYDYGNGSDSGWVADATHPFSYSAAGTYSAKLKVKDNDGVESGWSSTVAITVTVRPSIILLANSIDFSLASDLIEFFNNDGLEVIHATNADFDQYKNQKFIIILGGPDAYEGIGNITQQCLSDSQEEFLRSKGNRKMSIKTNVWSQQGQMVFIIAGSDRYETQSAHLANRGDIIRRLP